MPDEASGLQDGMERGALLARLAAAEPRQARPVVAILGGGLSGAATAFHLARAEPDAEIVVVEPRPTLGSGLAYSTEEPAHRINVPAARMALFGDNLTHFVAWLAAERIAMSPGTLTLRGDFFPERRLFGRYVAAQLQPFLASGAVQHRQAGASAVTPANGAYRIALSDGSMLVADLVVLAMTHPSPALPAALRDLANSQRVIADPYDNDRIAAIDRAARILIVGTGLTSADIVASLVRQGFRGQVAALSRHGLRSRGHGLAAAKSTVDFGDAPERTAVGLLRRIRAAVAADAARGQSWHAVLDRVREQGCTIWAALDPAERGRLVRHLRRFWDVHRFRIAPQVEAVLDEQIAARRMRVVAGRIVAAREEEAGLRVVYRPRGANDTVTEMFDAAVVTTGPDHGDVLRSNPVFKSLAEAGLLCRDPLGLGIAVADECHAIEADGGVSSSLHVVGPLARGCVGELMGVPEVIRHAEHVAAELNRRLAKIAALGMPA
ncbi:MAG: FAD/NAD(P)-binding protein [Amaricoccus sp.]